jgi:hypothetical protein
MRTIIPPAPPLVESFPRPPEKSPERAGKVEAAGIEPAQDFNRPS